jgi:hypothetical protein
MYTENWKLDFEDELDGSAGDTLRGAQALLKKHGFKPVPSKKNQWKKGRLMATVFEKQDGDWEVNFNESGSFLVKSGPLQTEDKEKAAAIHKQLAAYGNRDWKYHHDDMDAIFEYTATEKHEDAGIMIQISVDDLAYDGHTMADIAYSAGYDYKGHFGNKRKSVKIRSAKSMPKLFKQAEALWKKWHVDRKANAGKDKLGRMGITFAKESKDVTTDDLARAFAHSPSKKVTATVRGETVRVTGVSHRNINISYKSRKKGHGGTDITDVVKFGDLKSIKIHESTETIIGSQSGKLFECVTQSESHLDEAKNKHKRSKKKVAKSRAKAKSKTIDRIAKHLGDDGDRISYTALDFLSHEMGNAEARDEEWVSEDALEDEMRRVHKKYGTSYNLGADNALKTIKWLAHQGMIEQADSKTMRELELGAYMGHAVYYRITRKGDSERFRLAKHAKG